GIAITPDGVPVANPSFDVTPHRYVSAIITEHGIARAPYGASLAALASHAHSATGLGTGRRGA
ncbi:MAG TPA: hypothetical protein VIC32_09100, partial [Terriglobales bacterium]